MSNVEIDNFINEILNICSKNNESENIKSLLVSYLNSKNIVLKNNIIQLSLDNKDLTKLTSRGRGRPPKRCQLSSVNATSDIQTGVESHASSKKGVDVKIYGTLWV